MKIIDAHLHLDLENNGNLSEIVRDLSIEVTESGIEKVLVLHLIKQGVSFKELSLHLQKFDNLISFVNIDPNSPNCREDLELAVTELGYSGLKLHPRLQNLEFKSENLIKLIKFSGEKKIPVLIDDFPDGTALMNGHNSLDYAELARCSPKTKMIWAHMGGFKAIETMLLAKRLANVYLDFSYSLLYFRGSSIVQDILYALKSMNYRKVFYGSDYPDRGLKETLNLTLDILVKSGINDENLEKLFYTNFVEFMEW